MSATDAIAFGETDIPADTPTDTPPPTTGDYDPMYPGSTPEAPYGYKDDGTPYKRRPRGTAGPRASSGRMPATETQAAAAAGMLGKLNMLIGISLHAFGMVDTAMSLKEANDGFEAMAKEALLTDPELCKKILSTGGMTGKTGLAVAYGTLAISIYPAAKDEIAAKRAARLERGYESN